ncbi:hypothetical protein BD626DRAFT_507625 [Schizophyllum amplum]|uniref:MYND-type domain-containing protein n=1 Tax=Schizophyllum amplum TaxID=97359 RepID=A0A550C443_9AGAR|nr:hypothetical protein BD626DRAFT_507625 [Auriculariopsis ampla]
MSNDIRTFEVVVAKVHRVTVALGYFYTGWALVLAKPPVDDFNASPLEQEAITMMLSTISHDLPFPPPNPATRHPCFCMKTYSENEGMLPQLIALGVLRKMPIPELQNGPIVEVALEETEISYACMRCSRDGVVGLNKPFELPGQPRLQRCSRCKVARYCNQTCQKEDWEVHKQDCKLWLTRPSEAARLMENRRRAEMSSFLDSSGFQSLKLNEHMGGKS